jgi:hypothetical protein
MRAKVKIEFCGMSDANIYGCSRWNVARFPRLFFFVRAKQSGVMSFLDYYEGDTGLVIGFELNTKEVMYFA